MAALCWGFADYAGGRASRSIGVLRTTLRVQVAGALAYGLALVALGRWPAFDASLLVAGAGLGLLSMGALAFLYRALVLGPIGVVSPITASYLALTVLLAVLFLGETLTAGQGGAIVVTFLGVMLTSTDIRRLADPKQGRPLPGVRIALLAMLGFGAWGALFAAAARVHDPLALVLVGRVAGALVLLAAFALAVRATPRAGALRGLRLAALIACAGILDTGANVAYALGVDSGPATLVATGSGAYGVVPAMLAFVLLGERLAPNQYAGIAVLIAGLVGLGLAS